MSASEARPYFMPPRPNGSFIGSARSNSSLSSRTHLVIQEIERLKSQNEKIKRASAQFDLQRLPYSVEQHAADTKARREEIKVMIMKAQELDLAFLLDATASMQDSIDMVKDKVAAMSAGISQAYPECTLRVAFVLYRDYDDPSTDLDAKGCNLTSDFDGGQSTFIRALSRVRAKGGGDAAEDVFTGLQRVANLDWQARNRLLVHICDAPCHGTQFHDFPVEKNEQWDNYPQGDKYGRNIHTLLMQLREHCQITHYYFCHLNDGTKKMMQEFKKAAGEPGWIEEAHFRDINGIPQKVVTMSRSTISRTLSNLSGIGSHAHGTNFIPENVIPQRPNWATIALLNGQQYKHRWYHFLDGLMQKIANREPLEVEEMDSLQVQIATHPFSAEGTMRWPYHAAVIQHGQPVRNMVVKRFKVPFGHNIRQVHSKERYLGQMEVQTVAAHMAHEFNNRTSGLRGVKKVEFTLVSTLQVGSKIYNMEKFLEGNWIRYSNNAGYVNTADYAATLQAFTHWTHERSNGLLMVTDLQGVMQPSGNGGRYMFWLCDPSIHCTDVMRFTRTNLGDAGFRLFFSSHKCNDICRHLDLKASDNGYSTVGTQVG